jgi:hypothetical protein
MLSQTYDNPDISSISVAELQQREPEHKQQLKPIFQGASCGRAHAVADDDKKIQEPGPPVGPRPHLRQLRDIIPSLGGPTDGSSNDEDVDSSDGSVYSYASEDEFEGCHAGFLIPDVDVPPRTSKSRPPPPPPPPSLSTSNPPPAAAAAAAGEATTTTTTAAAKNKARGTNDVDTPPSVATDYYDVNDPHCPRPRGRALRRIFYISRAQSQSQQMSHPPPPSRGGPGKGGGVEGGEMAMEDGCYEVQALPPPILPPPPPPPPPTVPIAATSTDWVFYERVPPLIIPPGVYDAPRVRGGAEAAAPARTIPLAQMSHPPPPPPSSRGGVDKYPGASAPSRDDEAPMVTDVSPSPIAKVVTTAIHENGLGHKFPTTPIHENGRQVRVTNFPIPPGTRRALLALTATYCAPGILRRDLGDQPAMITCGHCYHTGRTMTVSSTFGVTYIIMNVCFGLPIGVSDL